MLDIRREMPVLARHQGDWAGTYTLNGNLLDRHQSYLTGDFPADECSKYYHWHWFKNKQIYQRALIQEERLKAMLESELFDKLG